MDHRAASRSLSAGFAVVAGVSGLLAACLASADRSERASEATVPADEVRAAVVRSLPLLQSSAQRWIEEAPEGGCVSCHHQGLGTMAVVAARQGGFAIDERLLKAQVAAILPLGAGSAGAGDTGAARRRTSLGFLFQGEGGINGSFGQSYLLLALAAVGRPRDDVTDAKAYYLAGNQTAGGQWFSFSHRPPLEDSPVTGTALAARALALYGPEGRSGELEERLARARAWLERASPVSTEERVMRLLGLRWTNASAAAIHAAADELLAEQRVDGGWAQIPTRDSDAYATGQSLTALHQAGGVSVEHPAYRRGVRFLLDAQLEDGSWLVETRRKTPGLPYFETGFPHQLHQFISYAASAWATIALVSAVGPGPSEALFGGRPARDEGDRTAREAGMTPLMLAAAFGGAADVRRSLEAGEDPNARGPGGATPLHLAVRDASKVELLLEHGAVVDATTEQGRTPLHLAASSAGGGPALELLLAAGASPNAPDREGVTPLQAASLSGDVERLRRLHAAGALLGGGVPHGAQAFASVAYAGDVEMCAALLDLGVDLDTPDEWGATPLITSTMDGWTELVRLLLARGAAVDVQDEDGMTALAWAAKIDPGHTLIVEALLAAGADPAIPSKHGRTPLQWAEHFGHGAIAEVLRAAGQGG